MKKLTSNQKNNIKYFIIMTIITYIIIGILKYFNQFNLISLICGEFLMSTLNSIRNKVFQGSDKE